VPRPATIVLDRNGVVRWLSISSNFQVRPDPADVLRAVRGLS
jgi:peroxiredoxin